MPPPEQPDLAFDIETTGLKYEKEKVTVAATYCGHGPGTVTRFVELKHGKVVYQEGYKAKGVVFCKQLTAAKRLYGYNAKRFDIPFLAHHFNVSREITKAWTDKTVDVFDLCKTVHNRTFSLPLLLELNPAVQGKKTGTGLEAIALAGRGEWTTLEDYCLADAKLTYQVSNLETINCPETYDWRKAHAGAIHDPRHVLQLHASAFPEVTWGYKSL
jgi:hypothetical protein